MIPKRAQRNYVIRPDGKPINVPRTRGQLFVCENGCCCGHTERGFAPVPHDLYYREWQRRKLRNRVHLNHAGCLGPCALANVAMLLFDGRPIWFHSINADNLILALFDYIEAMLAADRYLPPPPALADHVFNGFAWEGETAGGAAPAPEPAPESILALHEAEILFLTHADTDLLALSRAVAGLPPGFPPVRGRNLSSLPTAAHVDEFIRTELERVQVIVLRSLGGRQGFSHGFDRLVQAAHRRGRDLICVPGTEGLDPELTAHSNVPVPVIHDVYRYLHFGGVDNFRQLLRFLADHLLAGGWGYELPVEQPRHGIYAPGAPRGVQSVADWLAGRDRSRPAVAVLFYRSHLLSGNTDFVDALIAGLEEAGANALPVFTTSLKETAEGREGQPAAFAYLFDPEGGLIPDVLICTISFAMGSLNPEGTTAPGWNVDALAALNLPVLQAISSGMSEEAWRLGQRGLRPLDVAMNVALPEFDGRLITVPISFKGAPDSTPDPRISNLQQYRPVPDRVQAVVRLALRFAALRRTPNAEKRIAFVLTNSPGKTDRIGNAVGLDTPASLLRLFARMRQAGYRIENAPPDGDSLWQALIERGSYDLERLTEAQLAQAAARLPVGTYSAWFEALTESQRSRIEQQWQAPPGQAYVDFDERGRARHLALAGLELGHAFLAIQPPRGYGMDPDAIYHTPDLPPPHPYYALYKWLATPRAEGGWGADAVVHMGKHGTLEWLPGKGIGLSRDCFPDALLADLPLVYPFIINNPGEGVQAKRRAHAVIIDHMIPPMTRAEVYGDLAQLTQLVDEYYQVEQMDPSKLPLIQKQIWELLQRAKLDRDLAERLRFIDHGDHRHEWDGTYTDDGTPLTLAEMSATDFAHLLEDIDGYLCELGSLQIRDGLHILGQVPEGDQLCHLLQALTRLPNGDVPGLRASVATGLGWNLDELLEKGGQRLRSAWRVARRERGQERSCATYADVLEVVDDLCLELIRTLERSDFDPDRIPAVVGETFADLANGTGAGPTSGAIHHALRFVCETLVPLIRRNEDEIENLLKALAGEYVPAGPAGAPTRGMAHILPTGRNFYAVDPQAVPSQAAWRVGCRLADELIARYRAEEGAFPESVGLSLWGTSAMRTHGDDVAQCLALLGVRPVWQAESRRLLDLAAIPLAELGRPRIDVVMRVSGFFRDAFPHLLELLDRAVQLVANLDEPAGQNFVRKHFLRDLAAQLAAGRTGAESTRRASFRVFGSKPGAYGAGILPLINERNWQDEADFARAYLAWGGYAYGQGLYGDEAREEFQASLSGVQVAVKNQDNREHDIFDSDDYLQYHGGMIATIRALSGRQPKSYFGDNSDPARAEVRTLQQEAYRVFRSRVVNPRWLESIRRHGYKGALELAATVDYLFGYDATARVVEDWMYEQTAQTYALDPEMQAFFRDSNPWALQSIGERLLEAAQRGLWANPDPQTLARLQAVYLQVEAELEGREE